jgi:hypothetical protein
MRDEDHSQQLPQRVRGEDDSQQLPQRVRGAARAGPDRPARPHPPDQPWMSDDVRERIQAAVAAERANAAQDTEQAAASSERGNPAGTAEVGAHDPVLNPVNRKNGQKAINGHKTIQPGRGNARVISGVPAARAPAATVTGRQDPEPVQPRPAPSPRPQRTAQRNRTRRWRWRFIAVSAVALAAAVGSLVALAIRPAGSKGGTAALSPALLRQEAALRVEAAAWVAQQVSPGVIVSCDPAMCAALTDDAFPKTSLLVLSPTSPVPLTSAVIVATPAVRDMFGSSLSTAVAPGVLASFGSGPAGITVRVVAPRGFAAYWAAVRADQTARKTNGSALLNISQITVSAIARRQLAGGQVDSRLLLAVASLAADEPIDIVQFGNIGHGAGAEIPLRFADLASNDQAARMTSAAYLRSVRASLSKLPAQFRPTTIMRVVGAGGQPVLRVEFTAPSPLGLFATQGSP